VNDLRIVSFLPAATEMACALGLADKLVGVTHECDHPAEVLGKPVVVRSALPVGTMTLAEIDAAVSARARAGGSLYEVDERLLEQLAPTHILTQSLCQVCAPSGTEITRLLRTLLRQPSVLWFTPRCLADVWRDMLELGRATGREIEARSWIEAGESRIRKISRLVARATTRPRVFCVEWSDPIYCGGHWVPEMVGLAGGLDELGRKGADSVRVPWEEIEAFAPEVLIIMPCGFNAVQASTQAVRLLENPGWRDLPAVRSGQVFAVDANACFSRPGPRLIDGVELLAHLIHPELCPWNGPAEAFVKIPIRRRDGLHESLNFQDEYRDGRLAELVPAKGFE
jgi:iron complex transport system substrate-binding protein